jgi:hypothetical protein
MYAFRISSIKSFFMLLGFLEESAEALSPGKLFIVTVFIWILFFLFFMLEL